MPKLKPDTQQMTVYLPKQVYKSFRVHCARAGLKMSTVVLSLVQEYLSNQRKRKAKQ